MQITREESFPLLIAGVLVNFLLHCVQLRFVKKGFTLLALNQHKIFLVFAWIIRKLETTSDWFSNFQRKICWAISCWWMELRAFILRTLVKILSAVWNKLSTRVFHLRSIKSLIFQVDLNNPLQQIYECFMQISFLTRKTKAVILQPSSSQTDLDISCNENFLQGRLVCLHGKSRVSGKISNIQKLSSFASCSCSCDSPSQRKQLWIDLKAKSYSQCFRWK